MEDILGLLAGGSQEKGKQYSKVKHPFDNLQKSAVFQEARIFHDSHIVRQEPKRCCRVLAQLLRLQDHGDQPLTETEATEVFFGATKLFVSDDPFLRRMTYLFLKEMYRQCDPSNVIIVTSCLTKGVTCDKTLYRANSMRVLVRIIDSSFLGAIERYIKQAIVDSSSAVASSALVSAVHLYDSSSESAAIVRRWIRETQQATQSPNPMVQFHGLQLLYCIKSRDRLGVSKLVSQFSKHKRMKSPLARISLVRYAAKLIRDEVTEGTVSSLAQCRDYLSVVEAALKDSSDLVAYEAARACCALPMTHSEDLNASVNRLHTFLKSKKPATRYASLKTLSELATRQPRLVSKCNGEVETLMKDRNHAAAKLAVVTLLRTASESSIDGLLGQIVPFVTSKSDEETMTSVVQCLLRLCLQYPSKHFVFMSFLARGLRGRGPFEFKRSIVVGIVALIKEHPEAADESLKHLCEYIDDCEDDWLSIEILHVLGEVGPRTTERRSLIRCMYNRMILEQQQIRAAAVTSLTKFAANCPSLRTSILPLLKRGLVDSDDEVRDRAIAGVNLMQQAIEKNPYLPPPDDADADADDVPPDIPAENDVAALAFAPLPFSYEQLEQSLRTYMRDPSCCESPTPLTLSCLPDLPVKMSRRASYDASEDNMNERGMAASMNVTKGMQSTAFTINGIPELAAYGRVLRTNPPTPLTESETEYVVDCINHDLDKHMILQFRVRNTVEDQMLDGVTVAVSPSESDAYEVVGEIAADGIRCGDMKDCFTILKRNLPTASCSFACTMSFILVALNDGEGTGDVFQEEYRLEDLNVSAECIGTASVPPVGCSSLECRSESSCSSTSSSSSAVSYYRLSPHLIR